MTKKIVLTILVIVALLVAIYKWIMSSDDNEEKAVENTEEVTETATSEKEKVKPKTRTEEVKQNGEDTIENHKQEN